MRKRPAGTADETAIDRLPCACASIRRASRVVTQLYDRWLRAHGIEAPQYALLAMLARLGEMSQAAMGQRLDLDKTTLSRNLKVLKQKGWIEALPGIDGRERRVRLTPGGHRRLAVARPAWRRAQSQLRTALPNLDWDTALQVLRAITTAARDAERPPERRA